MRTFVCTSKMTFDNEIYAALVSGYTTTNPFVNIENDTIVYMYNKHETIMVVLTTTENAWLYALG